MLPRTPTLYLRDPDLLDPFQTVKPERNPECAWVWDSGRAIATRLRDGALCDVLVQKGRFIKLAKYKASVLGKDGRSFTDYYESISREMPYTGAYWAAVDATDFQEWPDGRLACLALGPELGRDNDAPALYCYRLAPDVLFDPPPLDFDELRAYLERNAILGILWYDADDPERTAQLRRSDFGLPWPPPPPPAPNSELEARTEPLLAIVEGGSADGGC